MQAIHLVVLYLFIRTIVDFPLALIDYYKDTNYLDNSIKKIVLGVGSVGFILIYGYRNARTKLKELFPMKFFNPLILLPIVTFLWADQNMIGEVNIWVEKVLPSPPWFWELFSKIFEGHYGIYGVILKVAVLAPLIEELIFRGIIMHGLMRNYSKFTAVFVSALMFALFHLNPWQFPATFVLGIILGILMVRTRNILLCILGHGMNNGLVLLFMHYNDTVSENTFYLLDRTKQLQISAMVIVLSLLLIILLSWKRNRKMKSKQL